MHSKSGGRDLKKRQKKWLSVCEVKKIGIVRVKVGRYPLHGGGSRYRVRFGHLGSVTVFMFGV